MLMFDFNVFLPENLYNRINEIKTFEPEIISSEAKSRKKTGYKHRHLVLAAADHNARMITEYNGDKIGLSNRREYLARLIRMLLDTDIDGVEASPDIVEDLIIANYLIKESGKVGFLDEKLLIGTVNRGGLKGVCWELNDMCTCFTVERIVKLRMDGIKFMLRIAPDAVESGSTLRYCADIVNSAELYGIPVFIEGLFVKRTEDGLKTCSDLESIIKTVGVVSALGCTSAGKWIELPICDEYSKAVGASTCSFLIVPDERENEVMPIVREYTENKGSSENIRGILLGRNVMYSKEPFIIARAVADVWHNDIEGKNAVINAENANTRETVA